MADESRATYHNIEVKIEGFIGKGFGDQAAIRNIAGEGKSKCVVFQVASKWQNKIDDNYINMDCKALGEKGEDVLDGYQEGDRVVVWGKIEEDKPYPRKAVTEDGDEVKVMQRRQVLIVDNIDHSRRFSKSNDNGGSRSGSTGSTGTDTVKKSSGKRTLL